MNKTAPEKASSSKSPEKTTSFPSDADNKRMSVTLTAEAVQALDFLTKSQGVTQSKAICAALITEEYLRRSQLNGSKVILQTPSNQLEVLVFR
jgi:hypothetical protein